MASTGTSPTSSEGTLSTEKNNVNTLAGDSLARMPTGPSSFMQRRRASFGKTRNEADPHADRMLQGHFSID